MRVHTTQWKVNNTYNQTNKLCSKSYFIRTDEHAKVLVFFKQTIENQAKVLSQFWNKQPVDVPFQINHGRK